MRLAFLALVLASCAPIQQAVKAADSAARVVRIAEPLLRASYEAQLEECEVVQGSPETVPECKARVAQTFRPFRDAYGEFRQDYCELDRKLGGGKCPQ